MLWLSALVGALLGAGVAQAHGADCAGVKAVSPKCRSQESTYQRDTFYIGGGYVASGIPGQDMWANEIYVEKLTPARPKGGANSH